MRDRPAVVPWNSSQPAGSSGSSSGSNGPGVGVGSCRAGDGNSVVGCVGMMVVWGRPLGGASVWRGFGLFPRGEGERWRRGLVLEDRQRCCGGCGGCV